MFATIGVFPLGQSSLEESQREVRWHFVLFYKHQTPFQFVRQPCSKHLGNHLSFFRENNALKSHHSFNFFLFISSTFYNPYNVASQIRSASFSSWPDIMRFSPQIFTFWSTSFWGKRSSALHPACKYLEELWAIRKSKKFSVLAQNQLMISNTSQVNVKLYRLSQETFKRHIWVEYGRKQ